MNITPLIDVMLVLLVMMIIALPMTVHQVTVDLPPPGRATTHDPVVQKLLLTSDGLAHWNGVAIEDATLGEHLRATASAGDQLQFQAEGKARYERFDQLIALVKQSGIRKIGFVGNEQFRKWEK